MEVLDGQGRPVDPASVDWDRYVDGGFPYVIRQRPGPWNALGQVKFIFPNPHFVFLHDTPSRALFARERRTFSSGCIRVQNPLELAELVLADPEDWDHESLERAVASGRTQTVRLRDPLRVLLLYWTVVPDFVTGDIQFLSDVYGRDRPILKALNSDFKFSPPQGYERHVPGARGGSAD